MVKNKFFDKVYKLDTVEETRKLYDAWSESYDSEVAAYGYATPGRIALALSQFLEDHTAPVLDYGCGTGLSGSAMAEAGFANVDGCDMSPDMLSQAAEKKTYRKLWQIEAGQELAIEPGTYAAITAVGVISVGAAPPKTLDLLVDALETGGLLLFSFNDHTLVDPRYEARVRALVDSDQIQILLRELGDHLAAINMKFVVYVVVKT